MRGVCRMITCAFGALAATACAAPGGDFDLARARGHIDMLATTIGSRPIGSPANARARAYLVDALGAMGFVVRVQETDYARAGMNAHVFNIIAFRAGAVDDAIGLVSHYDSVPQASGALDDALGVATSLEAARALLTTGLRHSLLVLITDGEEAGLLGASAAVEDPDVARRLKAYLNFDGTGAAGPALLFEAGPGWGAPLSAWAQASRSAAGGSFAIEIYKRLPNDTDFTVLQRMGASGLNFAPVGDSYAYHTDRDVATRVQSSTLRHEGENAVAIVRALDAMTLGARAETPTFFALAGRAVVYGPRAAEVIVLVACVGGTVIWLTLTRGLVQRRGWLGLVSIVGWATLGAAVAVAAMFAVDLAIRTTRDEVTPWYASPQWVWAAMGLAAAGALWIVGRMVTWLKSSWRPEQSPLATWWVTLPVWIALTVLGQRFAPAAAFLVALPLAAAVVALVAAGGRDRWVAVLSLGVFAVAALLWVQNVLLLMRFVVPLFGWMSIPTPSVVFPALLAGAGLMLVPPLRAAVAGRARPLLRPAIAGSGIFVALIVMMAMAWSSPAYTSERPLRRVARYVQDNYGQQAWWEVGSNEPALDLGEGAPGGFHSPPATRLAFDLQRAYPLGKPYAFSATAAPEVRDQELPADIRSSLETLSNGQVRLDITVVPRRPLLPLVVRVPRTIAPVASNLSGRLTPDSWRAVCFGVPPSGRTIQLTFDRPSAELSNVALLLFVPGMPGGQGPGGLPPWLSSDRTTWDARSLFVVPALSASYRLAAK